PTHPELVQLPAAGLFFMRLLAACGAMLLVARLGQGADGLGQRARTLRIFVWIAVGSFVLFNCLNWIMIDRYLLVFVPLALLLLAAGQPFQPGRMAWAMAIALSIFSVAATHDYLSWNRARHQGLREIMAQGVTPREIDGGFEFNGFYKTGPRRSMGGEKSWWFVYDDAWAVSLGRMYGYDVVRAVPYRRWLPPCTDSILVSRRKPTVLRDSVWCDMEQVSVDSSAFLPIAGSFQIGNGQTRSDRRSFGGRHSAQLDAKNPYGLSLSIDSFERHERFVGRVWRYPAVCNAGFVLAANDAARFWVSETDYLVQRDSSGWGLLEIDLHIPEKAVGQAGKIYLWNPSDRDTVWFDDFKLFRLK
ncbi:MAG: hypothetical protein ACKVUS_16485, partial [Saprospiraceae bacterium]